MNKPVTVIDKDGKQVVREDGIYLDGDRAHIPLMLIDGKPNPAAIPINDNAPVAPATLARARLILGDQFAEADYGGLTDTMARHTVVRKRLGEVANGRPSQFLDAAWNTLAGSHSASPATSPAAVDMPMLTDAQKAVSAAAVTQALADHATKTAPVLDTRAAYRARIADQHRSPADRAAANLLDGASSAERNAIKQGSTPHSYCKVEDQKLSDAEFYQRQRDYNAQRGSAA